MLAVNAALANQLVKFKVEVDALIDSGVKKDRAILKVLRRLITYSKPIRFDGDGYSQAWVEEHKEDFLTLTQHQNLLKHTSASTLSICSAN